MYGSVFAQPRKMVNKGDNIDRSLVAWLIVVSSPNVQSWKCAVLTYLLPLIDVSIALLSGLLLALPLLQQGLWNQDLVLGRDSSK